MQPPDDPAAPAPPPARPRRRAPAAATALRVAEPAPEVLRKPVNALAIVPRSHRITYLARKAYNVLLYEAQEQGLEREVFRTPLERVIRGVEFDSNDTALVKKHLRAMVSTTVEWQSPTAGEGTAWNVSGLLAHARLSKERGQVWVDWSYAVNLKQELLEPSVFARLKLEIISQLRSHAGVALYEICARYRDVGRTARHAWRWWHPVLTGQPVNEAKLAKAEYRIFKRDVLRGAVAEVSAVTDLEVELVEHRAGRFIEAIQFAIRPKPQAALPLSEQRRPVDLAILKEAAALGIDDELAEKLVEQHGEAAVRALLPAVARRQASAYPEPLRDAGRYLRTLLGNAAPAPEAGPPAATAPPAGPPASATANAAAAVPADLTTRMRARWTEVWRARRREALRAEVARLTPEALQALLDLVDADYETRGVHPSIRKRLHTHGWTHPLTLGDVLRIYARGAYGDDWDRPSADELLAIAAETG
jgi:hypothetical protein